MHHADLILTLTGSLAASLVLGYWTHCLRLSPIVGYLLAGLVVGEYTPGFVANKELADQMAEIGVILLMFGVGLQFHLRELLAVRRVAIPGALGQSLVATLLGMAVGRAFGWDWSTCLVFGLAISVASTVVLTRVLSDTRDLHTPTGHIAVGWLVVEDLFTVLVLVLLPSVFGPQEAGLLQVILAVALAVVKLLLLIGFALVVGGRVIPWILRRMALAHSRELFTLTVLTLALGIAVGSALLFGASMALGAFLAGMIVGRSEYSLRAAAEALPMRDAFAVLFFVSVGMLFDPAFLLARPGLIAATTAVILLGKPLAALIIVLVLRYPLRVALSVAIALAQIGEFSFILATLGKELRIFNTEATNALIASAILSITLNPLLYRLVGPLDALLQRLRAGKKPAPALQPGPSTTDPTARKHYRAVVVGYGPVGATVVRLLKDNGIEPTIVEMNLETVQRLRAEGLRVIYGDACQRETLQQAGVAEAVCLILSSSGMHGCAESIRHAREINPRVQVIARTAYLREVVELRRAGSNKILAGEGEVALAMAETLLRTLGATPEQIERERDRVRQELFGSE